jgi:hypothetical protein
LSTVSSAVSSAVAVSAEVEDVSAEVEAVSAEVEALSEAGSNFRTLEL